MAFKQAVREKLWGRIALEGPSGGGKTMTGMRIAMGMLSPTGRLAVIDTEQKSARKYVGEYGIKFDVDELDSYEPQKYVASIKEAAKAGAEVLLVDSLSHAWFGKGGLLEQVDEAAKRMQNQNSFAAWKTGTPIQNELIDALLSFPGHVIVTMRTKTEYVLETNNKGKQVPKKIGMAAIQRDGMEYEFDVVATVTIDHDMVVTKTRCPIFVDAVINQAGEEFGQKYLGWLNIGAERPVVPAPASTPQPSAPATPDSLRKKALAMAAQCNTADDISKARARLASEFGGEASLTGHVFENGTKETFLMILTQRWADIKAAQAAAPAPTTDDFLARVKACTDPTAWAALEKEFEAMDEATADAVAGEMEAKRGDFSADPA